MSKQNRQTLTGQELFKRILPIIIALVLIGVTALTVVLVTNANNRKPTFASAGETYFELGDLKVTNDKLYTVMKQDYGVAEVLRLIDNQIYAAQISAVDDEELKNYVIESLYGVEDLDEFDGDPQEEWDDLIDSLLMNNLIKSTEIDDRAYNNYDSKVWSVVKSYYRLQFARENWAKEEYIRLYKEEKDNAETDYFTEDEIEDYYEENYTGSSTGIIIPFANSDSAYALMKKYGINTQSSSSINKDGWVKDSYDYNSTYTITDEDRFTAEEIIDIFVKMYNEVLGYYNNGQTIINDTAITSTADYAKIVYEAKSHLETAMDTIDTVEGQINLPTTIVVTGGSTISIAWELEDNDIVALENNVLKLRSSESTEEIEITLKATLTVTVDEQEYNQDSSFKIDARIPAETKDEVTITVEDCEIINSYAFTTEFIENPGNEFSKFAWDLAELTAIDSKVASNMKYGGTLSLSSNPTEFYKSYTITPVSGTNYAYLMIKFTETADPELEGNEELENEIIEKLLEELLTTNNIDKMIYDNRTKHNFQLFDKYLEAIYEYNYKYFYGTTLSLTDYPEFKLTKKREKTVVASVEIDGNKFTITAEELFNSLEEKYGVSAVIDLINEYSLMGNNKYNTIYNPYTGETYNSDALKELLQTEVSSFRNNFEMDYFTYSYLSYYGYIPNFPSKYGWNDFRTDYFGAFSDQELLVSTTFGGQVYTDAFEALKKELFPNLDELIMNEMQRVQDEFYSLNVINLIVSIDTNYDGTYNTNDVNGDDDDWTAEQNELAKELAKLMYAKASETGESSLYDQLSKLVSLYNEALYENNLANNSYDALLNTSIYDENIWAKYKKVGLIVKLENSTTSYTNTSSLVEEFLDQLQILWDQVKAMDLIGETLDAPLLSAEPFESSYGYHHIAVVKTTAATELPTDEQIEIYKALTELNAIKDLTYEYKEKEIEEKQAAYDAILEKYGYDSDYAFDEATQTLLTNTYDAAVTSVVEESDELTKLLLEYLKTESHTFHSSNSAEREEQLKVIIEVSEKQLNEEEGE